MEYMPPQRRFSEVVTDLEELKPDPINEFYTLDAGIRYLWMTGRFIFWLIVSSIGLVVAVATSTIGYLLKHPLLGLSLCIVLGILMLLHLFWPFLSYRHWGYALRRTDVLIRSGVLWKSIIAVPFNRIQHVDNDSGPLERSMGLANLVIHTAGSQIGAVRIPGLPIERAEALRDYLSKVGHTHANI